MTLAGTYELPWAPAIAFEKLRDPEVLARCIPGCERLERNADGSFAMKMKLALAAISGQFDGSVRITDEQPPESFRLVVDGSGRIGFMKGDGRLRLEPSSSGTTVHYSGEVQVGGVIAGVGQRLIDTTSRHLIKKFFDTLAGQ